MPSDARSDERDRAAYTLSDSSTSSSENESLVEDDLLASGVQALAIADVPSSDSNDDDNPRNSHRTRGSDAEERIPHKVAKLRRLVLEALHCAVTISSEAAARDAGRVVLPLPLTKGSKGKTQPLQLDVKEPWMKLSRVIIALRGLAGDGFKVDDPLSARWHEVLAGILQTNLIPLCSDKAYLKSLARNEAKAIPSLVKSWSKAIPHAGSQVSGDEAQGDERGRRDGVDAEVEEVQPTQWILDIIHRAALVLLRFAQYALGANTSWVGDVQCLDLSQLRGYQVERLDTVDCADICFRVGIDPRSVQRLSFANNGWKRLPAWSPFPFPHLCSVEVALNPDLTFIPITYLTLPITQLQTRGTAVSRGIEKLAVIDTCSGPLPNRPQRRAAGRTTARDFGPPTLQSTIIRQVYRPLQQGQVEHWTSGLPPHLIQLITQSYLCDICGILQIPSLSSSRSVHPVSEARRGSWMERSVGRAWAVEGTELRNASGVAGAVRWSVTKTVRVRGRVCLDCYTAHFAPS